MANLDKVAAAVEVIANEYKVPTISVITQLIYIIGDEAPTVQGKINAKVLADVEKKAAKVRKSRAKDQD